jgi:hypothetical protein
MHERAEPIITPKNFEPNACTSSANYVIQPDSDHSYTIKLRPLLGWRVLIHLLTSPLAHHVYRRVSPSLQIAHGWGAVSLEKLHWVFY